MNFKIVKAVLFFMLLFGSLVKGLGQIMPANTSVILAPPHPIFLSDYYALGSNSLQAVINFTDFSEPSWDIKLKVTIESEDIRISTSANFSPAIPITLTPGLPTTIQGDQFYEYLHINNVDLQGITPASLNQSGRLPEGLYNFCIEVLDFKTGTPLSLPVCNSAYLFMEPPPIVLSPECEGVVLPSNPQNVFFQWQIAGGASPIISSTSQYKLSVYEVTGENTDPYFAVQNSQALLVYESDFMSQLSMALDFNTALLVAGKKYTFRVRAVDADEQDIYANNGYSEWCWFYYGYPSNGVLATQSPIDEHVFGKYDQKIFSWSSSDVGVTGQQYNYTLEIKELNDGQTKEDAIANNSIWFEETLPPSTSTQGYTYILNENIGRDKKYVWQVKAKTGGQEVAKSEIQEFLGPPLVENFYAGNSLIQVESITNGDPNNLSGTARVHLSNIPTDYISISFDSLKIIERIGNTYLESGEINFDLSDRNNLELTPVLSQNGVAQFIHENGKINKNGLKFFGSIEWGLPHAVSSGEQAIVKTQDGWFTLNDSYQLNGVSYLNNENDFTLLNPLDLRLDLSSNSRIDISNNEYTLKIQGDVYLSEEIKTNGNVPYSFPFSQQPQLHFFEVDYLLSNASGYLLPSDDLKMGLMPKKAIVDLSETESPGKLEASKYWKGVYFPEFKVRLIQSQFDVSNQIVLGNTVDYEEDLSNSHKFWVSSQGLQLKYSFDIEGDDELKFNGFKTNSISTSILITNNELLNTSKLTGAIKIPVLDKQEFFTFEVPIVGSGLAEGFLNQDLTERELNFNPFGGENRINITINRAVFQENNRLRLNIDAEIPVLGATVTDIDDFRIYGDGYIGVGAKNGKQALTNYVEGIYNTYPAFIQEVGASLSNGNYAFSYVASMDLGEDIAGENGPPLLAVSSVEPAGDDVSVSSLGAPAPQIAVPDSTAGSNTITAKDMYISVNNAIVEIDGYLKLRQNDPKWGTAFMGGINGKIKIPTEIQAGANMVLGKKDEIIFWYFDAWFNDTQGLGIPVFQAFNLVAMEGRIYSHMSKQEGEYVVDPSLDFGAGIYMQIIDQQQKGRLFVADIGAEVEVSGSNFTVAMEGDISGLNASGRTGVAGSAVSAVGEEIAAEVLAAVGPISFDFDIAGGNLTVTAEGIESGALNYIKGDLELGFEADMGSVPAVGFNFSKGNDSFLFNAAASGDFNLGVGIDGNDIGLGMRGRNEGYLDLSISSVELHSTVNREAKTGSLTLGISDKLLDFGVESDGGYMNLEYDATHAFKTGFKTTGSAFLGVKYDDNIFEIAGDKSEGSGSLYLNLEGVEMNTALNTAQKTANFSLTTDGINIQANGAHRKGGAFLLELGQDSYDIAANLENNTGHIDFEFNGDKRLFAELTEDGQGALLLKNGSQEFGLSGNTAGTAGSVHYKDNTAEFTISADKVARTGNVGLAYNENYINSAVTDDSSFIELAYENIEFETGITSSGRGKVRLKEGTNEIAIEGDLENHSGLFLLTDGSNKIYAEGNANATGKLELIYNNNEFKGGISEDSLKLYALSGDFEMDIAGDKNGNGKISLKNGSIHTRLALDRAEEAGEIYYKNGDDIIHVAGNKTQKTGLINVDIAGVGFNAYVDDSVSLSVGPIVMKGSASESTGFIKVNNGNDEIKVLKTEQEASLNILFSDNNLKLGRDFENAKDFVVFENNNIGVGAYKNHTGIGGGLNLNFSDYNIGVGGDYTTGDGSINFLNGDFSFDISANANTKKVDLDFIKGNVIISAKNTPSENKAFFNATNGDHTISSNINTSTQEGFISYKNDEFEIGAEKENSKYKIYGKYAEHDISAIKSTTDSYLKYEGYGVVGKVGKMNTPFISATYNEVEVKIQDEKVFVNENEIFDFSGVLPSGSIDFSNFYMPGVDLSEVDFTGIESSSLDLSRVDFTDFDFTEVDLNGINFSEAGVDGVDLSGLDFSGMDFSGVDLSNINFSGVDLDSNDLSGIDFSGVDFSGVDLSGIDFSGIDLPDLPDLTWNHEEVIDDVTVKVDLDGQKYTITVLKGADSVELYTNNWIDNSVDVFYDGHNIRGARINNEYELGYNDMSAKISSNDGGLAEVKKGESYKLKLTNSNVSGKYNEHEFKLATNFNIEYKNNDSEISYEDQKFKFIHDDKKINIGLNEFKVYYSEDKNVALSSEGLEVNFEERNLTLTNSEVSYASGGNYYKVLPTGLELKHDDKEFELKTDLFHAAISNDKSVTYTLASQLLSVNYEDKSFSISGDKQITYNDPDRSFDLSTEGLSLAQDGKSVSISENEMAIVLEESKKLKIANGILDVTYETRNVKLGATSLYYTDGTQTVDLSEDALALSKGDNRIYVNTNEFGLNIGTEKHLVVNRADQAVSFKYDDIQADFSNNESLSFTDGQRSFALGSDGLEMSDGNKSIAVVTDAEGEIGLRMINDQDKFFVNKKGFEINYDGQRYAINEEEYLTIKLDETNRIEVASNGGKFISGDTELIIGGTDNFLEVKDAERSIALSQEKSLVYSEGDYVATLTKDLEVELTDGIRTIELFKDDKVLTYLQSNYSFGIRGGTGVTPGIDISDGTNTIYVEGERNSHATVGVESSDFGDISFTCNSAKDIEAAYEYSGRTLTLSAGNQGISFEDSDNAMTQEPELPPQIGTETPEMDGPQYLGDGITASAGGRVKGHASLYYNSAESHFIANASVISSVPPCISGSFGMEVKPGTFNMNVGSREQKVVVKPYCIGLTGEGFIEVRNENVQFGIGLGFEARGSVDIGVAEITAYAEAMLGIEADIDVNPFKINEATLYARAAAGLEVDPAGPVGSFTVASASISGNLKAKFYDDKTNVSGNLNGNVTVLGISEGFSMGFNKDF